MSNLQNYNPFQDLWGLGDEVSRFLWGAKARKEQEKSSQWLPAVDITEDTESIRIHAELPGLKKEDVKITLRDGVLSIQGERKFSDEKKKENYYRLERSYGVFTRSFSLPTTVDSEKVQASMKDGVLELVVPKKPEAKEKEISINVN